MTTLERLQQESRRRHSAFNTTPATRNYVNIFSPEESKVASGIIKVNEKFLPKEEIVRPPAKYSNRKAVDDYNPF